MPHFSDDRGKGETPSGGPGGVSSLLAEQSAGRLTRRALLGRRLGVGGVAAIRVTSADGCVGTAVGARIAAGPAGIAAPGVIRTGATGARTAASAAATTEVDLIIIGFLRYCEVLNRSLDPRSDSLPSQSREY